AGVVLIERDGQSFEAPMSRGLACANVGAMGEAPLCLRAAWREGGLGGVSNPCVPSADEQLLFGDWHTHDFNSTAEGWPADPYLWARDEMALDFLSVPVQVHRWIDNEKWALVKHFNEYFLDEGRFVTLLAFEYQHSGCGDKVVHFLGGDQPYLPVDLPEYDSPAKLYAALRQTDAVVISHHPGYALDLHVPGTRWEAMDPSVDRLVELWSMHGSSEGYDPADRPLIPPRREGGAYEALRNGPAISAM
ncbi:MAG: hypothetical protein R6U21_01550, partial [Thermoplasmatota archaeon]